MELKLFLCGIRGSEPMFGIFAISILQVVDIQLIDHTDKLDTARIIHEPYDIPRRLLFPG